MDRRNKTILSRLVRRREIFLPTPIGWILIGIVLVASLLLVVKNVHPFLAITEPANGGALVIEGWVPDYAYDVVLAEFRRNRYEKLYVVGGPVEQGVAILSATTYAEIGARTLYDKGASSVAVQAVPAPKVDRDRTYASAVALKRWLRERNMKPSSYHVMTIGPHARRTRLLFTMALGEGEAVGVTAIDDQSYDKNSWWKTSSGVRTVMGELIAYVYAKLIF